jgi:hypothetical protein
MYNIVDAIYQMVVSRRAMASGRGVVLKRKLLGRSGTSSVLKEMAMRLFPLLLDDIFTFLRSE